MRTLRLMAMLIALAVAAQAQVNISSRSDIEAAQAIAEIIAHDIMQFDTLTVIVFPLPKSSQLEGAVEQSKYNPHTYTLLFNESMSLKQLIITMSHEFIHIHQYEFEGLAIYGDIWEYGVMKDGESRKYGETWGSMDYTEYETRKFELDAYEKQGDIASQVMGILKDRKLLAKMKGLM